MALFTAEPGWAGRTLCVSDTGLTLTYGDLDTFAGRFAAGAEGRSLGFLLCENTPGVLLAYLSCLRLGAVPVLLDAHIDPALLAELAAAYSPAWVFLPGDVPQESRDSLGPMDCVLAEYGCALLRRTGAVSPALHPDLAVLLTTSGSTGSPKLVRQSRANIEANARSIAEYLELTDTERPITTLPMNYTYGLSIVQSHALVGAAILLTTHGVLEGDFWRFFLKEKATSLAGVPYTYKMFHRLRLTGMDLPSLRYMTQAGGKLPEELHQVFAQWCADTSRRFYVMYGQCEATARMGYLPYQNALSKVGSMGIPIPGGSFRLTDDSGAPVPEGEVGELIYHGPNVTMGYAACAADLARGDDWQGVLHTGDMARRDPDGYYYIVGRKKRFIKLFGNRVGLDESERLLSARFPEAEFACTGRDDLMTIFTDSADPELPQAAIDYLSGVTHLARSGFSVTAVDAIPKNEAGKTLYTALPTNP